MGRDVAGAAIKVLCKKRLYYDGRTMSIRIGQLMAECKAFAARHGKYLTFRHLKKKLIFNGARTNPLNFVRPLPIQPFSRRFSAKGCNMWICVFLKFEACDRCLGFPSRRNRQSRDWGLGFRL